MVVLLFVGGSQPESAGMFPEPWDKLVHLAYFFILTTLFCQAGICPGWALLLGVMVGGADEWHQYYLPGRDASLADLLMDISGALLAVYLAKTVRMAKLRNEPKCQGARQAKTTAQI